MGNPRVTHVRLVQPKTRLATNVKKKVHWGGVGRPSKTVDEVEKEDYAFLGEIGTGSNRNSWFVDLWLNDSLFRFKIVTRADVQ